MGRDVPARVIYWTGVWDPAREALSKEVAALRSAASPKPAVVSFARGQRSAFVPTDRVIRLSSRRWILLKTVVALLERRADVSHVFGGIDDWHLLRAIGRRPVVFTVALDGAKPSVPLWRKVSVFAAETEALAQILVRTGADPERITIIRPGVDLSIFVPAPAPSTPRFRLIFASSPAFVHEFADRGIPLLVEMAKQRPDIDLVLLWRSWGDQDSAMRALAALDPPSNVILERRNGRAMIAVYHSAHAVVYCSAAGFGKSAPNSVIEALACGRPALVATTCGLAPLIAEGHGGIAAEATPRALAGAIDELQSNYEHYVTGARQLAERRFDLASFLAGYRQIYERLAGDRAGFAGLKAASLSGTC